MLVSKSELSYLIKQTFEGCGFDFGACESAAEQIVWSEMYGFQGLSILEKIIADKLTPPYEPFVINSDTTERVVVEAKGNSSIYFADLLTSLSIAKCKKNGVSNATILNCRDPALMINALSTGYNESLYGLVYWRDAVDSNILHSAKNTRQNHAPIYAQFHAHTAAGDRSGISKDGSLRLVFADEEAGMAQYLHQHCGFLDTEPVYVQSAESCQSKYYEALTEGIEVRTELWQRLSKLSNNVLVKASEASRKDAGE